MITGIVLAAGTASRYGATKQLAVLDGRPLVQHAIDALAAASGSTSAKPGTANMTYRGTNTPEIPRPTHSATAGTIERRGSR